MFKTLQFILAHPFNRGRPLGAIARYAAWQLRSRLVKEVEVDWIAGTRLIVRKGMTGATGNIYCGLHEWPDMLFVLHTLRPGDLFVDVGANVGSYTVLASGVCGARCVAIEPDGGAVRHLTRNIEVNRLDDLVDLKLTAVGEEAGSLTFTTGLDTMNHVASVGDRNVQTVPVARLDDLLDGCTPALIKMDVEGFETPALRGAEDTLARSSLRAVMLETVEPEALKSLQRHGFKRLSYCPHSQSLVEPDHITQSHNALFVRDIQWVETRLQSAPVRSYLGRVI